MFEKLEQLAKDNKKISDFHIRAGSPLAYRQTGEIVKVEKNRYVASSTKDKSLYFFELNKKNEIINLKKVYVYERVRDLILKNNYLYLFLEDTASLGKIKIK